QNVVVMSYGLSDQNHDCEPLRLGRYHTSFQAVENNVPTRSIDNLVEVGDINKIDFIKMDIEGSETKALLGAVRSIERFKPKLAIAIYHGDYDIFGIPLLIK